MSSQTKRKITLPKVDVPKVKDLSNRPSVFDRLGIKKALAANKTDYCRQWSQHGVCPYGKTCKFAYTHTLISPSKRVGNKDGDLKRATKDDAKSRLHSTVVVRSGKSPDGGIDNWDQNDLEYADTDVLEKRRLQLQRELEIQLKMESGKKTKKKHVTSSSSSRTSSTSSVSSSSSGSSSSTRDSRKKRRPKPKRASSSSSSDVPPKKKITKAALKKDPKKVVKKDDRSLKKHDTVKKKTVLKTAISKKGFSPNKKAGGTPPIGKNFPKDYKHKSPIRKEKHRSVSPKDKKEREKERDRERERIKSRSRVKSRSPRRHRSLSKDKRKSVDRSRPTSPKKRRDHSDDKHSRDRARDNKDRSIERRKNDKDRHDRKEKPDPHRRKEVKREPKREERDRGLNKGLKKPSKPMERLLPRPEERMAALAAISGRNHDSDKAPSVSKERQDSRKAERSDRDRSSKQKPVSVDRERSEYERRYNRSRSVERPFTGERYREGSRDEAIMSPSYRRYEPPYDVPGHSRGYPEEERGRTEFIAEHRGDIAFEERRQGRRSWEGRGSIERERGNYKEWESEEYRPEWKREKHWPHHEQQVKQVGEWPDKTENQDANWQSHGRQRIHADEASHSASRAEAPHVASRAAPPAPAPDDLSEISDDADDILNQDDLGDLETVEYVAEKPAAEDMEVSMNIPTKLTTQTIETRPECSKEETKDTDQDKSDDDYEEISDGELEEEKNRGLSDALGVDWASLVRAARVQASGDAATRSSAASSRIAISKTLAPDLAPEDAHPIASMQVVKERREEMLTWLRRDRGGRALSARHSLALRRVLCRLPPMSTPAPPAAPHLFAAARALRAAV